VILPHKEQAAAPRSLRTLRRSPGLHALSTPLPVWPNKPRPRAQTSRPPTTVPLTASCDSVSISQKKPLHLNTQRH